jgi:hypothetical protein
MTFHPKPIKTANGTIIVHGKVIYNDKKRKIDLKKPIRDLFDATSTNVFYMMEFCLSKGKALERIEQLTENEVMPVLLYFVKGDNKDEAMS